MQYSQDYSFRKGRRGISKDEKTFKLTPVEGVGALGLAAALGNLLGSKKKNPKTVTEPKRGRRVKKKEELKAKYSVKAPPSKPKFSNIQVPVGKPKQTRKPQTLKNERTESQTFTKKQRPGMDKKETVKVNVVN